MPWSKVKPELEEPNFHGDTGDARTLTHAEAVHESLDQALARDPLVYVMGQGVDDPGGMFGSTKDLHEKHGSHRVFDTPLSENALMGIAVGSAMRRMRPVYFHNRPDFLLLALDQLANHGAKWSFMTGGEVNVPLVVWACIGRGWGSAAQHSQALQATFMHFPGLKLVMPSTGYDAKGLMISAIADPDPVVILEHRYNFKLRGPVPEQVYKVPIGKGVVRRPGKDVSILTISQMVHEAYAAAEALAEEGIDAEVVDLRSLRPLDEALIIESVRRTGRVVVADHGWRTMGITAEIAAVVAEKAFDALRAPIGRVASPDVPTPAGYTLENAFYVGQKEIEETVRRVVAGKAPADAETVARDAELEAALAG